MDGSDQELLSNLHLSSSGFSSDASGRDELISCSSSCWSEGRKRLLRLRRVPQMLYLHVHESALQDKKVDQPNLQG